MQALETMALLRPLMDLLRPLTAYLRLISYTIALPRYQHLDTKPFFINVKYRSWAIKTHGLLYLFAKAYFALSGLCYRTVGKPRFFHSKLCCKKTAT